MHATHRFVSTCAVGAVVLAALGASWLAPPSRTAATAQERPSLQAPAADVVRAPAQAPARQPVACVDCRIFPAAPAGQL